MFRCEHCGLTFERTMDYMDHVTLPCPKDPKYTEPCTCGYTRLREDQLGIVKPFGEPNNYMWHTRDGHPCEKVPKVMMEWQERTANLLRGQAALKAQTVRIRKAALGGRADPGDVDTEEIVAELRARVDRISPVISDALDVLRRMRIEAGRRWAAVPSPYTDVLDALEKILKEG